MTRMKKTSKKDKEIKSSSISMPSAYKKPSSRGGKKEEGQGGKIFTKVVFTLLAIGALIFVLMGGVNQRKLIETVMEISHRISRNLIDWFEGKNPIDITDDGVYIEP